MSDDFSISKGAFSVPNMVIPELPDFSHLTDLSDLRSPQHDTAEALASINKRQRHAAKWMHQRLTQLIIAFEKRLSSGQEVGARLVGTPDGSAFHIENLRYVDPDLVIFQGSTADGNPIQLLQHVSQVSISLVALPVRKGEARRIGFLLQEQDKTNP